ncbi:MAG: hypothetical protein LQ350_007953 [Teloschistes chrysophthalmus]|nr:MAG: hypothetical protein LQ350_007953 [Niorma chrysophthalma]
MTAHLSNGAAVNGNTSNGTFSGVSLQDLPKTNVFTSKLPPDPKYKTPSDSHNAPRKDLGPRMVKGALYTFVRPEETSEPELLGVSPAALRDIGLSPGEENTSDFKALVAGNKIYWDPSTEEGVYPWAQCYGGYQFGSWASQLGDGRAISLFESTNPSTKTRYEIQLKGAGQTPYSRFADGKAVLRSSIREFIVSEALNALGIPSTRALSLTLAPESRVRREKIEPGAIVTRFAQSWLRIGTFDLLRARGDRNLTRTLATYVAENVYQGWESLPAYLPSPTEPNSSSTTTILNPPRSIPPTTTEGPPPVSENRFARLYREIVRRNALTVAKWQAYAFTNGVLNTDNTSLLGLSLDFGPFAFLDDFDPSYTPNHDDHALRYSYRNQPSIIWWNLVRLGESLGELIGAGPLVDDPQFINQGVAKENAPDLIARAESVIERAGAEYKSVFLEEYTRLMRLRFGFLTPQPQDFNTTFSEALDIMEAHSLDFHHFFRRLSSVRLAELDTLEQRQDIASRFFHAEGVTSGTESAARERIAKWLEQWRQRIHQDWDNNEEERIEAMKTVNPNFIPRSWVLDEVIQRVEKGGERDVIGQVMAMALRPFEESWGGEREQEKRWCGDVPRGGRGMMCSCSS